mmetsp:Transcript_18414/g.52843  ORF Transcript_18414/g.52843 Transcript_18414/m.52843 type:complete len:225 (+) Transcript_18414:1064-1738(+)
MCATSECSRAPRGVAAQAQAGPGRSPWRETCCWLCRSGRARRRPGPGRQPTSGRRSRSTARGPGGRCLPSPRGAWSGRSACLRGLHKRCGPQGRPPPAPASRCGRARRPPTLGGARGRPRASPPRPPSPALPGTPPGPPRTRPSMRMRPAAGPSKGPCRRAPAPPPAPSGRLRPRPQRGPWRWRSCRSPRTSRRSANVSCASRGSPARSTAHPPERPSSASGPA